MAKEHPHDYVARKMREKAEMEDKVKKSKAKKKAEKKQTG